MNTKKVKNSEFDHFSSIASEWWQPNGKFKILHEITPLRIRYILDNIDNKIKDLDILDVGCGAGLTCEPLSRLGAKVSGIDFVKKNIEIAKKHAQQNKLNINYINRDIVNFISKEKYDVILLLEVIEHLDNWKEIILKLKNNLKPKGKLILSTINRTKASKIFAIFFAENILKWVPKNTHDYKKLIKPHELAELLIKNKFEISNITGMNYNLLSREWKLNKNFYSINYFCTAKLI